MPASPLICKKLTREDTAAGLEKEMMRQAHWYKNDVDLERSHLNEGWVAEGGMEAGIDRRIAELDLARKLRCDAVRAEGIIITTGDLEMAPEQARLYLREANDWLDARYGRENTVAWSIHMDEGTPHLHRWQVPVIEGGPGEHDRVSARELFNPTSLRQLQEDFYREVASRWGFDPPLTREQRQESGIRYADFATYKKAQEIERVEERAQQAERERASAEREASLSLQRLESLRRAEEISRQGPAAALGAGVELAREGDELERQGAELESRCGGLEAERAELERRVGELELVRGEAQERVAGLEAERADAQGRVGVLEQALEQAREGLERVRERLLQARERARELCRGLRERIGDPVRCRDRLHELRVPRDVIPQGMIKEARKERERAERQEHKVTRGRIQQREPERSVTPRDLYREAERSAYARNQGWSRDDGWERSR